MGVSLSALCSVALGSRGEGKKIIRARNKPRLAALGLFFFFFYYRQGAQTLAQVSFLGLLNEAGREAISAVVRQGTALYPPAASRLKDVCSNYSSLKGSDKWFLASILLLVARPVLHDVMSLVRDI